LEAFRSYLRKGQLEVLDVKLRAIWIVLQKDANRLPGQAAKVTIFGNAHEAIRPTTHRAQAQGCS
jgi:hypothetical protein